MHKTMYRKIFYFISYLYYNLIFLFSIHNCECTLNKQNLYIKFDIFFTIILEKFMYLNRRVNICSDLINLISILHILISNINIHVNTYADIYIYIF
jgi:hypothetical protein